MRNLILIPVLLFGAAPAAPAQDSRDEFLENWHQWRARKPVVVEDYQLSASGWFAAGNILGGFHGAEWCFFNGRRVARSVVNYLSKSS